MKTMANHYAAVLVSVAAAIIVSAALAWAEGGSMSWEPNTGYQTPVAKTVGK